MQDEALARVMELLGTFNDRLTKAVDAVFSTRWAEIEEMVALIALARDSVVTTRDLAEVSGLNRRAISRLIARLTDSGLVERRSSPRDGRVVEVVMTKWGQKHAQNLRTQAVGLLHESRDLAREIADLMESPAGSGALPSATDPLTLLLEASATGAKLVSYMPAAATRGRMAARQRAALVYIATHEGVRPSALAEPLEVSHAGVAYLIDQLCTKAYIRRHRHEVAGDQRAVTLRATSDGLHAVATVAYAILQEREALSALFLEIAAWQQSAGTPADTEARV